MKLLILVHLLLKKINYLVSLISKKIHIPMRPGELKITHSSILKAKKFLNGNPKLILKMVFQN